MIAKEDNSMTDNIDEEFPETEDTKSKDSEIEAEMEALKAKPAKPLKPPDLNEIMKKLKEKLQEEKGQGVEIKEEDIIRFIKQKSTFL